LKIVEHVGLQISALRPQIILGEELLRFGWRSRIPNFRRKKPTNKERQIANRLAAEIGVKTLIVFSGGDPTRKDEQWSSLVELTPEIVDYAEKTGTVLAIENMVQLLVDDEDTVLRLINEVNSKNLMVHVDAKNLNITPPERRDIPEAIRKLRGLITHVHMGDSIYGGGKFGKGSDRNFILHELGKGEVPIKECLLALTEIGYDGWIVLEHLTADPSERQDRGRRKGILRTY